MPRKSSIPRVCQRCGKPFDVKQSKVGQGKGKYCSRACGYASRTIPVADRFWPRVDRSAGPDGCWLWLGALDRKGYGHVAIGKKKALAHRVAWDLLVGPVPDDIFLCHNCDNPRCVNPTHLFTGTAADNMADKVAKGRQSRGAAHAASVDPAHRVRGERHSSAKLNPELVREMRQLREAGLPFRDIAARFGVAGMTVRRIVRREAWAHVT